MKIKELLYRVEESLCLVCKRNCIEDGKNFLIDCMEYDSLGQKLYFHISIRK